MEEGANTNSVICVGTGFGRGPRKGFCDMELDLEVLLLLDDEDLSQLDTAVGVGG